MRASRGVRSVAEEWPGAGRAGRALRWVWALLFQRVQREVDVKEVYKKKSSIALGIVLIALVSIMETWMADHRLPNPASPIVWSVLGAVAVVAFGFFCWFRAKANQAPD